MEYEIPELCKNNYQKITRPNKFITEYDSYAILDLNEYVMKFMKDIYNHNWHEFFSHNHLSFAEINTVTCTFQEEINNSFTKMGLQYIISENGQVERVLDISEISEETISLYRDPKTSARKNSVEKIWDAFERLKTYYTNLNKRQSSEKVCRDASLDNLDF